MKKFEPEKIIQPSQYVHSDYELLASETGNRNCPLFDQKSSFRKDLDRKEAEGLHAFHYELCSHWTEHGLLVPTGNRGNLPFHVLKRKDDSRDFSLVEVLSAEDGEFLFFPASWQEVEDLPVEDLDDLLWFSYFFDRLRDSPPHFGASSFGFSDVDRRAIHARTDRDARRWLGARCIYTKFGCNYLWYGKDGVVGYVPLDPDRKIDLFAGDLGSGLLRWLRIITDRIDYEW